MAAERAKGATYPPSLMKGHSAVLDVWWYT